MIIFKHSKDLQSYLKKGGLASSALGFVPTMGALHLGHLSLIYESKKRCLLTICSIFVNPTQFNNPEDFKKYPITLENDILLLEEAGCDILFLPDEKEMYPEGTSEPTYYDLGYLDTVLEGKFRPGHFQGVCIIVNKLLTIINPQFLFLGQKDFQQCMVIRRMLEITHKKIEVVICPILRESSGLALSSRNLRLQPEEKDAAAQLFSSLETIKKELTTFNFPELRNQAIEQLENKGFKVEYLEMANIRNLQLVSSKQEDVIVLIAAFIASVRLIDNMMMSEGASVDIL